MGGTLLIRNEPAKALWLPQSSTYDALLESAAAEIVDDEELAKRFMRARLEEYGGYVAIDDLDEKRFALFVTAVQHALEDAQSETSAASLAELMALLRTDARAGDSDATGTIIFGDEHRWTAPRWLFDFVVAHLGLDAREGVVDVRGRVAELLPRSEWMSTRYGDGEGRGGHAPPVYARIAEGVNALHEALLRSAV